jgi:hypothetical protein
MRYERNAWLTGPGLLVIHMPNMPMLYHVPRRFFAIVASKYDSLIVLGGILFGSYGSAATECLQ